MKKILLFTGLLFLVLSAVLWAQGTEETLEDQPEGSHASVDHLSVEIRHCYS